MTKVPWILLIHQLPPKPDYLRVKVWRLLQKIGSIQIKNSVYVLPNTGHARESFAWILKTIENEGGDGAVCEARFIEGLTDSRIEALFNEARNESFQEVVDSAKALLKAFDKKKKRTNEDLRQIEQSLQRLNRQFDLIAEIDFFGASGRETTQGLLREIDGKCRLQSPGSAAIQGEAIPIQDILGRTWVTRQGLHVDRLACAWLIRKFIERKARFKFVDAKDYKHSKGELRFDMSHAEFTHEGDDCSFEVIIRRLNLREPALKELSEIIHDIDLKDEKFKREEARGLERIIGGIVLSHKDDLIRIDRASLLFDDLYSYFKAKR